MCVSVDWVSLSAPDDRMESLRAWWSAKCGDDSEPTGGNAGYRKALRWPDGARLAFDQVGGARTCSLSLNGQALAAFGGPERLAILGELMERRCTPTRLDIAVDWRSERETLIDDVQAAAARGELVGFRRRETIEVIGGGDDGSRTLYLGRRGKKGGGRFVRVYDKGVEQGTSPPGKWVRWEAVFSGPLAAPAAASILDSGDQPGLLRALALGVCDFRIPLAGKPKRLWARASWWSDRLTGVLPIALCVPRRVPDFEKTRVWLRQNTKIVHSLAEALGKTPGVVYEWLTSGVKPSESLARNRVVRQGIQVFRSTVDSVATSALQS